MPQADLDIDPDADAATSLVCPVCGAEAINVQGVTDCTHCEWTGRR